MAVQSDKRLLASVCDVSLDRNHLISVKEKSLLADTYARFFLHVLPVDTRDLPASRRAYGFDNRDFRQGYWELDDRRCIARGWLPAYPVRQIRTGQFVKDAQGAYRNLWKGEFVMALGVGGEQGGQRTEL